MSERYRIINSSVTSHCCFQYSVVDTARNEDSKHPRAGSAYQIQTYGFSFAALCECWEPQEADAICSALNSVEDFKNASTTGAD